MRRRVSIFVPAFNERNGIQPAVRELLAAGEELLEDFEILLVDDGSTDGTGELADRLGEESPHVRVFHHPRNLGLRAAYETGLRNATMEFFTFLPGDNEVHPDTIRNMFRAVGSADVVIPFHAARGNRPWYRKLMTFVCTTGLNALLGNRLRYYQGPNIYPTTLARVLPRRSQGFFFLAEMTAFCVALGYSTVHVEIIHQERIEGQSKAVSLKNIRRAVATIVRLWWELKVLGRLPALPADVARPRSAKG